MRQNQRRITPLDLILVLLLGAVLGYVVWRIQTRLQYTWDWSVIPQYLVRSDPEHGLRPNLILIGLINTVRISIWSVLLATCFGAVMGLASVSSALLPRLVSRLYVETVRNLPPLVLIFIVYFFLSGQLLDFLGLSDTVRSLSPSARSVLSVLFGPPELLSAFVSAVLTLALYEGAYITEIVRAGVQSVERGQWEAAFALGLSPWQRMRHVILPLTVQRIIPPLAGQFISTIKDSAIVSVISVQELTFQGLELMAATYLTFEIWITVGLLYLLLCLTASLASRRLELYLNRSEA